MNPILYLDVDGVLNGTKRSLMSMDWPDVETSMAGEGYYQYEVNTSRQMGQALLDLALDIRWATTWADSANTCISPLVGFPQDLPVACRPKFSYSPFKFDAISNEVEQERVPFVWIDDEAISFEASEWAEQCGVPNLLITPRMYYGITRQHIEEIQVFIESVKDS